MGSVNDAIFFGSRSIRPTSRKPRSYRTCARPFRGKTSRVALFASLFRRLQKLLPVTIVQTSCLDAIRLSGRDLDDRSDHPLLSMFFDR